MRVKGSFNSSASAIAFVSMPLLNGRLKVWPKERPAMLPFSLNALYICMVNILESEDYFVKSTILNHCSQQSCWHCDWSLFGVVLSVLGSASCIKCDEMQLKLIKDSEVCWMWSHKCSWDTAKEFWSGRGLHMAQYRITNNGAHEGTLCQAGLLCIVWADTYRYRNTLRQPAD